MKYCKRYLCLLLTVCMLSGLLVWTLPASATESAKEIYVAVDGSDTEGNGTLEKPFATLEKAWNSIKESASGAKLPDGGVTIFMRGGIYRNDHTVALEGIETSENSPIVIQAYQDEQVIYTGAVPLNYADFRKLASSDAMYSRIPASVRSNVIVYDLTDSGAPVGDSDFTQRDRVTELLVDGQYMTRSRYPDDALIGFTNPGGGSTGFISYQHLFHDGYDPLPVISDSNDAFIFGYLSCDYFSATADVSTCDGQTLYLSDSSAISGGTANGYFMNAPEFISMPGEYYIDKAESKMYVYGTSEMASARLDMTSLKTELLTLTDDYVTIDGIQFEGTRCSGLNVSANHTTIQNCILQGIGQIGVTFFGNYNLFTRNLVQSIGSTCVDFGGGDVNTLTPSHSVVSNNKMFNYALHGHTYNPGVALSEDGCQLTVRNNEIAYSIHNGITGGCYDALIEYNYVHDVCSEAHDAGALYTGAWHSQNMTIRYNLFRNIVNKNFWALPSGIYVDDGGSSKTIYGNIIDTVDGMAMLIGGGHNIQIYNNLVMNSRYAPLAYDERQYLGRGQYENTVFLPDGWDLVTKDPFGSERFMISYMRFTYMTYTDVFDVVDRYAHGAVGYSRFRGNAMVLGLNSANEYSVPDISDYTLKFLINVDNPQYHTSEEAGINEDYTLTENSPIYNAIPYWSNINVANIGTIGW